MRQAWRFRLLFVVACVFQAAGVAQSQAPYRLTLKEAIDKALQANLSVLVSGTRVHESEGTAARRFSNLLPHVRTETYANYQNRNLRAFGLSIPGLPVPQVIGPFSNYDFRIYADQSILDLESYRSWKASKEELESGKLDFQDARDLIVRSVASLYLNGQAAEARIEAAHSRVRASEALDALARAKHDAGTATGVDVLRAQVQLANDQQALLVAQNQYKQALLVLARSIGIDPGTELELAEPLQFQPIPTSQAETVIASALFARSDYLSLASQRQSLTEQQRANRARWYPKLSLNGNYGALGRSMGDLRGIGLIQGQIDFTIFDHDREGEAQELSSRIERVDDQLADLRRGIAEDIREALLNLESSSDQVKVAQQGRDLAERELELTQDRFQSGVTNNVEVVTAQDELARAQENYILAVASYSDAKFALARAAGGTEKNLGQYMAP
ncbi:Outer membrane efflux protein [Candidatus Sulfotelmatobacter kueseliae]|uniref:Outer membrane efflux protein n=1 Tax=Candidatus Sulfotelmatobacter kueseliae TaxID=2042962 RepID=A0A2U3KFE8_9BACT|nr:Outer membrane efflux protein [Candidatus Sulfotelmatobacter kueseliae]